MNALHTTLLSVALAGASSVACAQSSYAVIGAGCVPTGQTSNAAVSFNSAGDTGFAATKIGEIILTCPVPSTLTAASSLAITFRDTDGSGGSARVLAVLRQKDLATGAVSDVGIARVDSNRSSAVAQYATAKANIANGGCGNFTFDHDRMAYYVQVNITRTQTTAQPLLASVMLQTPVC
jgi:hypothetical protein